MSGRISGSGGSLAGARPHCGAGCGRGRWWRRLERVERLGHENGDLIRWWWRLRNSTNPEVSSHRFRYYRFITPTPRRPLPRPIHVFRVDSATEGEDKDQEEDGNRDASGKPAGDRGRLGVTLSQHAGWFLRRVVAVPRARRRLNPIRGLVRKERLHRRPCT
ncbi:hypothetical protein PMAYCL1PPCAC_27206, partial [Pristionchus mayeri]